MSLLLFERRCEEQHAGMPCHRVEALMVVRVVDIYRGVGVEEQQLPMKLMEYTHLGGNLHRG